MGVVGGGARGDVFWRWFGDSHALPLPLSFAGVTRGDGRGGAASPVVLVAASAYVRAGGGGLGGGLWWTWW